MKKVVSNAGELDATVKYFYDGHKIVLDSPLWPKAACRRAAPLRGERRVKGPRAA